MVIPLILDNKYTSMPSVFAPAALLREARRQKGLATSEVPPVCILDPDGDLVRELRRTGAAKPFAGWPQQQTLKTRRIIAAAIERQNRRRLYGRRKT